MPRKRKHPNAKSCHARSAVFPARVTVLAMIIATLITHVYSFIEITRFDVMLVNGTIVGFAIIETTILFARMLGTSFARKTDMLFSLLGATMFLLVGVVVIANFADSYDEGFIAHEEKVGLGKGILALVITVLYMLTGFVTFIA